LHGMCSRESERKRWLLCFKRLCRLLRGTVLGGDGALLHDLRHWVLLKTSWLLVVHPLPRGSLLEAWGQVLHDDL